MPTASCPPPRLMPTATSMSTRPRSSPAIAMVIPWRWSTRMCLTTGATWTSPCPTRPPRGQRPRPREPPLPISPPRPTWADKLAGGGPPPTASPRAGTSPWRLSAALGRPSPGGIRTPEAAWSASDEGSLNAPARTALPPTTTTPPTPVTLMEPLLDRRVWKPPPPSRRRR